MKKNSYHKRVLSNKNFEEISYVKWEDTPGDKFFFSLRAYGESKSRKNFVRKENLKGRTMPDYFAIEFIEQGQLLFTQNNTTVRLQPNDLIFYRTNVKTLLRSAENEPMVKKYINIKANRLLLHFFDITAETFFIFHGKNPDRIKKIFEDIYQLILEEGEFQASDISANIYKLIYDFFITETRFISIPDSSTSIPHALQLSPEKYKDIKTILQEFHITRYALTKLFRDKYDTTPMAYLISMRLNKARWYLENTATPVNEIAHLCGIENIPLFTRQFKKVNQCTPGEYRKMKSSLPKKK